MYEEKNKIQQQFYCDRIMLYENLDIEQSSKVGLVLGKREIIEASRTVDSRELVSRQFVSSQ